MKTIKYGIFLMLFIGILVGCSSTGSSKSAKAADYYSQLGVGYLQKGRLDLATLNLEKALKENSRSADAHHYYALLQERLGNDDMANKHFREALSITPKDSDLLNNYGSHLCRTGKYAAAEEAFIAAVHDPLYKTPEFAYTNAGICVRKTGNVARAEEYFRLALEKNNRFSEALYQMAKLNREKGEYAKAEAFLYRYNENAAPTPESLLLCYQVQTSLQEMDKAESCAVALRGKFPDSAAASEVD
ncbi:type IV pilus biogenesis/stability protein PilW [Candidatus Thiothrix sp. Deng01]|uniref:Type IV pilus biogenesis/stability protein PilW n=1 Tax=Candidatus Thiothrix phosphatis TaxID=3112415 RepID=A0ABU6CRW8_9GAMM|nr:type IV pilus biogenesis/stability protein PilW [Candidatus Thiothrix sp. Deng01]MEB4589575.1 type IV pilus biogenesis/stability protein PilW [Candidatus Thiothrix sp. Deng01]